MTKSELRMIYLEKRKSLSADEKAAKSRHVAERFFAACDLNLIRVLHCFIPIEKFNEIDTSLIYKKMLADFPAIRTIAPYTNFETGEIESRFFTVKSKLIENKWGIREPVDGETVEPSEIDLVLVPLLSFDERGYRVGYGKGLYDKFLAKCRTDCLKIGLSYFPPVDSVDDIGDHDIPLDLCISPERTYQIKRGG